MASPTPRARRIKEVVLPAITAAALVAAWHAAVVLTGTRVFPSPLAVWRGVGELARSGLLLGYARDSLLRVGAGYSLAAIVGVPLGLAAGRSPSLMAAVSPVIQLLQPISPLAWIPFAIAIFGIRPSAAISLIFLASLFPIVVSSADAVRGVPPIYVRAGQNLGLGGAALFARVILPASLPRLLTGLRVAFGVAWMVVVAAEMIAVDSGLGYLIMDARNAGKRYDLVVAGMILIGVLGLSLDTGLRAVARMRSVRWGMRSR